MRSSSVFIKGREARIKLRKMKILYKSFSESELRDFKSELESYFFSYMVFSTNAHFSKLIDLIQCTLDKYYPERCKCCGRPLEGCPK